ncbi:hypothetical protein LUZ60_017169 [Juncus effusus]|nr:hypothetical protein LUZ60_017169 [Juncus effusus]
MATMSNSSSLVNRTCLCAPTTHPGSFRCQLHRATGAKSVRNIIKTNGNVKAMADQKAKCMKDVLMKTISPSRPDPYRRKEFRPMVSRFCMIDGVGAGTGTRIMTQLVR